MEVEPKKRNWKKIGCLIVLVPLGILTLLVILGMIIEANMTPEEKAARDAEVQAEKAQADAALQAKQAKESAEEANRSQAQIATFKTAFTNLSASCDAAQMSVGEGLANLATINRVVLAGDVQRMGAACAAAWRGFDDIPTPSDLTDKQQEIVEGIERDCPTAFWARKEIAEKLMPVIDGDMRPSVIASLQSDMQDMQGYVARCAVAMTLLDPPKAGATASAEQ